MRSRSAVYGVTFAPKDRDTQGSWHRTIALIDCARAEARPARSGAPGRDALALSGMTSRAPASAGSTETTESDEAHTQPVSLAEGVTGRCPDADLEPSSCLSRAAFRTDARTRGLSELTWLALAGRSCLHGVTTDTLNRLSRDAVRSSDNSPSVTVAQLTVDGCAFTIVDSSS
jgi:hypothetical protein